MISTSEVGIGGFVPGAAFSPRQQSIAARSWGSKPWTGEGPPPTRSAASHANASRPTSERDAGTPTARSPRMMQHWQDRQQRPQYAYAPPRQTHRPPPGRPPPPPPSSEAHRPQSAAASVHGAADKKAGGVTGGYQLPSSLEALVAELQAQAADADAEAREEATLQHMLRRESRAPLMATDGRSSPAECDLIAL